MVSRNLIFLLVFLLIPVITVELFNNAVFAQNDNQTYSLSALFKEVENSVVQISSQDESSAILGDRLGSGFVYDSSGHVITNNHVTAGSQELHVTFSDGTIYSAKVVGSDPYSDLAVLLLEDVPKEKLIPLKLGNSSTLIVGQPVAAVGNPFGLSGSLTEGIISGLGRLLPSSQEPIFGNGKVGAFNIPGIIQTDAAINPGNSGGPLLNLNGEVIGINSAIFSNTGVYAGVGFAIPSNTIKKVIPELMNTGKYEHPWIGVTGVDITPEIAQKMNLTEAKGFLVIDVNANSPADKAGLRGGDRIDRVDGREIEVGGDIIIGIDGNPVRKIDDILTYLELEKSVGDTISLTIIRNGTKQEKSTALQSRPDSETLTKTKGQPAIGVTGIDITPEIAQKMNLTEAKGFLVIDVNANSPADKAGLRGGYKVEIINDTQIRLGGDVITSINDRKINNVTDLTDYIANKKEGDVVKLKIIRDGEPIDISATLEVLPEMDRSGNFQIEPFPDNDSNEMDRFGQGKHLEELKKECVKNFNENICNFLFR